MAASACPVVDKETALELQSLQREIEWLMTHEVSATIDELLTILEVTLAALPMNVEGSHKVCHGQRFVLSPPSNVSPDLVRVVATLSGDSISQADIHLRLPRPGQQRDYIQSTSINDQTSSTEWHLPQIQDAVNHLVHALHQIKRSSFAADVDGSGHTVPTLSEARSFFESVLRSFAHSQRELMHPKKKTFNELRNNEHMLALVSNAPPELAVSFFVQGWRLVFAVYHAVNFGGSGMDAISSGGGPASVAQVDTSRLQRYQVEAVVPWLADLVEAQSAAQHVAESMLTKINALAAYGLADSVTSASRSSTPIC